MCQNQVMSDTITPRTRKYHHESEDSDQVSWLEFGYMDACDGVHRGGACGRAAEATKRGQSQRGTMREKWRRSGRTSTVQSRNHLLASACGHLIDRGRTHPARAPARTRTTARCGSTCERRACGQHTYRKKLAEKTHQNLTRSPNLSKQIWKQGGQWADVRGKGLGHDAYLGIVNVILHNLSAEPAAVTVIEGLWKIPMVQGLS